MIGTTRSYACTTQAGLTRLGSNVMRTTRVGLRLCPRRATLTSLCPWRGAFVRGHSLEWGTQKPIPIPGAQLYARNTCRELYRQGSNFVGSVMIPPWGVPVRVSSCLSLYITPARKNFQRRFLISLSATRFLITFISLLCGIVSK